MQSDPSNSADKFSSLENIAKLAPIFTALVLAISVTYDSAFLLPLGLTLFDIPSSISEHLRSAILWSPIVLAILMLIGIIFGIVTNKENKVINKMVNTKNINYQLKLIIGLTILELILVVTVSIIENKYIYLLLIIPFIWLLATMYILHSMMTNKIDSSGTLIFLYFLPLLLIIFSAYGYYSGYKLINNNIPKWEYKIKEEERETSLKILGHRRFTEFTIAVVESKKILILPNSIILSTKSL